jgi:hypothetical protein
VADASVNAPPNPATRWYFDASSRVMVVASVRLLDALNGSFDDLSLSGADAPPTGFSVVWSSVAVRVPLSANVTSVIMSRESVLRAAGRN